jgi:CheY-like chemotaxis protein
VASTILAVDDSVTLRKVLEITFAGPEFKCITVPGPDAALEKVKTEKPAVVIADVTLGGKDGYELCKAIKQVSPTTPVLILSSKHNPYDQAKGASVQADDHMDKPYDTTQMIDKVRKLLASPVKDAPKAAATPVVAQQPQPLKTPTANVPAPIAATAGVPLGRSKTLLYNPGTNMPAIPGANPAAATKAEPAATKPAAGTGTPAGGLPAQPKASPAVSSAAAAISNGQLASRLEELGLTPTQVEGVLALSKDVIERVVWEVVPVLAETLIREEIARLTK